MSYINLITFLIPNAFIRFLASERHTYIILVILSLSKIMPIYSRCTKKKLVYIVIIGLFGC